MDALVILMWLCVVAWASFISYRTGRDEGIILGEWRGAEKASADWEKAIESRGLVLADDLLASDDRAAQ